MNKRVIIVSGGTLDIEVVREQMRTDDFIIGVDRGVEFLEQNDIKPNYVVGDFDSVSEEVIRKYRNQRKIPVREYNPVKDASDTEIAVRLAMELGFQELIILGATGSRLDHMWANVQVLAIPFEKGIKASIIDGVNRIRLIESNILMKKEEAFGQYFSVFSLGGMVEGLSISGSKYPLNNHELLPYDSLSVSNEFKDDILKITYKSGILIFMESKES
ncbi:MAG: thiamine diphosphokinase [Eubacteriales bacterium]